MLEDFKVEDEQNLVVNNEVMKLLEEMKNKKKFLPDEHSFYKGATSEKLRVELEEKVNILIKSLLEGIKKKPLKSYVLIMFKELLLQCDKFDTEDRERLCLYLEELMDIFEIESSDGLLNTFMYGFEL